MIQISHRGNYKGRVEERENSPDYIEEAIAAGYNVEVDVRLVNNVLMLGHDFSKYEVPLTFLERPEIWAHAKNLSGYFYLHSNHLIQVFWHDRDDFAFTSKGIKWCKTGILTYDGIMVMPELNNHHTALLRQGHKPLGVCSDNFSLFTP